MKIFAVALLLVAVVIPSSTQSSTKKHSAAYLSMQKKLDAIARNGERQLSRPVSTEITAEEANAWVNEGGVPLPAGVSDVRFSSVPAVITAQTRIDFDKLTEGIRSANPLLSLFSGVHDVQVVAQASANQGIGNVRVDSMSIDGVKVPRVALEFFVNRYIKPKYPNVGLDTRFKMPARVDLAVVGTNNVTVSQK